MIYYVPDLLHKQALHLHLHIHPLKSKPILKYNIWSRDVKVETCVLNTALY